MNIRSNLYEISQAILGELAKYAWAAVCIVAGVLCYANLSSLEHVRHNLGLQAAQYSPCEVSTTMSTGPPGPDLWPLVGVSLYDDSIESDAVYITTQRYRL